MRSPALAIAWLAICLAGPAARAQPPGPKAAPIDRTPYSIRILVDFDPSSRVDPAGRSTLLEEWSGLARRFVGEPWAPEFAEDLGSLPAIRIEDLKPDDLKSRAEKADKVWAIRVSSRGPGYAIEGRELDARTGSLGELQRREVAHPSDLAREWFRLCLAMFTPSADVGESKGGGVTFLVQGISLPSASPLGEVAPVGTVFRALRIFPRPDGSAPQVVEIRNSYFRVDRVERPDVHCEIITGLSDPLTRRVARKNSLVAVGVKPSSVPTRLRFKIKDGGLPAVGFRLIARTIPPGPRPTEIGMTDRDGRIVLPAGKFDGLVSLRLLAGDDEPMLDIPVMPGESRDERTIVFESKPITLAIEARLEALRDAITDVVADRHRLEAKMKARLDGEDWGGLDETTKAFRKLTPRGQFESRLEKIRAEGEQQQAATKSAVLTRTALARIDETKGLIDRYLDDELVRSYEDASERGKAEAAAAAKSAKKAKKGK